VSVPKRWIDDGAPEPVRELLIAASGELPGEASARRTLVALGVSGALATGASGAAGAAVARGAASVAAAAKSGTTAGAISLALKWGFVGAVSAVASAGVATIAFSRATPQAEVASKPARAERPATASIPGPQATNAAPEEAPAATSEVPPAPIITAVPRTHAINGPATMPDRADIAPLKDETTGMMEEVSMIDHARAAVARGDALAALDTLDAYAARFKVRRFEPEALYLRMEALGRAGDREGRRRVAQRLLTAFPSSPQCERAREALK
jgi:hypothetical protein